MRPPSLASRPAIRRSVVDLPQPDGPSSTLSVPASNANETSSTARTAAPPVVQTLLTFSAAIADIRKGVRRRAAKRSIAEQRAKRRAGIGRAHERFADEKRVD